MLLLIKEARENQKHLDEKKNNEKLTLQTQITQLLDSRDKVTGQLYNS